MTEEPIRPASSLNRREVGPARANPTIRDVARVSNVSISTVSKALNNNGSLRQETRERIASVGGSH